MAIDPNQIKWDAPAAGAIQWDDMTPEGADLVQKRKAYRARFDAENRNREIPQAFAFPPELGPSDYNETLDGPQESTGPALGIRGALESLSRNVGDAATAIPAGAASRVNQFAGTVSMLGLPFSMVGDALSGGGTEMQDAWAQQMVDPAFANAEAMAPRADSSFGTQAGAALGGLGIDMGAMLLTGGASAAPSVTAAAVPSLGKVVGGAVLDAAGMSVAPSVVSGTQTAIDVLNAGGTPGQALAAGGAEAVANAVTNVLPLNAAGGVLSRALQGAGSNVVADAAATEAVNPFLPDQLKRDPYDPQQMGISAILGAPMGVMFGERPTAPVANGQAPAGPGAPPPRGAPNAADDLLKPGVTLSQFADAVDQMREALAAKPARTPAEQTQLDALMQFKGDPAGLADALGIQLVQSTGPAALPPPGPIVVDSTGTAATAAQRAQADAVNGQLGMTPDIQRVVAAQQARESTIQPASQQAAPGVPALPPPDPITVDSAGIAATPAQRREGEQLGITPDIQRIIAAQRRRESVPAATESAATTTQGPTNEGNETAAAVTEGQDANQEGQAGLLTQPAQSQRMTAVQRDARIAELRKQRAQLDDAGRAELLDLYEQDRDQARVMGSGEPIEGVRKYAVLQQREQSGEAGGFRLFFDGDNFKKINDTFGHAMGDEVIRSMGEIAAQVFPENIFHKGGDEFVVSGSTAEDLQIRADRLRAELAQAAFGFVDADGKEWVHNGIQISLGIGRSTSEAEQQQYADKRARAAAGLRTERGSEGSRQGDGGLGPGGGLATGSEGQGRETSQVLSPPAEVGTAVTEPSSQVDQAGQDLALFKTATPSGDGLTIPTADASAARAALKRAGVVGILPAKNGAIRLNRKQAAALNQWISTKEQNGGQPAAEPARTEAGQDRGTGGRSDNRRPSGDGGRSSAAANPAVRGFRDTTFKPAAHDLLDFLALRGGLNREVFQAEGIDPAYWRDRAGNQRFFGRPLFRKGAGMTPEGMREALQGAGFMPEDPPGQRARVDANDAIDALNRALERARNGQKVMLGEGTEQALDAVQQKRDEAERDETARFLGILPDDMREFFEANPDALSEAMMPLEPPAPARPELEFDDEAAASAIEDWASALRQSGVDEATATELLLALYDSKISDADPGDKRELRGTVITRIAQAIEASREQGRRQEDRPEGLRGSESASGQLPDDGRDQSVRGPEEGQRAKAEVAPTDLFGALPIKEQALADARAKVDAKLTGGNVGMLQGVGELFAGPRPEQVDLAPSNPAVEKRAGEPTADETPADKAKKTKEHRAAALAVLGEGWTARSPRSDEDFVRHVYERRSNGIHIVIHEGRFATGKYSAFIAKHPKAAAGVRRDSSSLEALAEWSNQKFERAQQPASTSERDLEPTPEPTRESKSKAIEDFGQRLEGARKHYAQAYADKVKDALGLDVATNPLSQTWPEPDYDKLIEGGADPFVVAWVHAARDEIPTKPSSSWKLAGWVKQVELLRTVSGELLDGTIASDKLTSRLYEPGGRWDALAGVRNRAELYQAIGHGKSLKGITLEAGSYSMYEGIEYRPPRTIWTVARSAVKGAFGNWPRRIAWGDTKEQAIAAFKAKLGELSEDASAKATTFEIYSTREPNAPFFIGKKINRTVLHIKDGFTTVKEARTYLADNKVELEAIFEKMREIPDERRKSNAPRVGIDHRAGGDVTPEKFADAFGFRGVQFGNYVEAARRQQDLNNAYDALMDMAGVLGVPPRALSLNGELGLAFGARGKGGRSAASAHYESDNVVINLTKGDGAGSLAHEWWHALDNYFARMAGDKAGFMTRTTYNDPRVRQAMLDAFAAVNRAITSTRIRQRSRNLDKRRSKDYWTLGHEMSARSFESYVIAKLKDQGAANDYLANIVSPEFWESQARGWGWEEDGESYPYPAAAELPAIRAAFDHFFSTVETRDNGGVIAFLSRSSIVPGDGSAKGMSVLEAQAVADDFLASYNGNIPLQVRVAAKQEDLYGPKATPERVGVIKGAYHAKSGLLTLAAVHLQDRADAIRTLRHETVGHFGLNTLTPDGKLDLLRKVIASKGERGLSEIWAKVDEHYAEKSELERAEEVFAFAAEQDRGTLGRAWDSILATLAKALRAVGLIRGAVTMPELRQLAHRISEGIRTGKAKQQTFPESDDAQFSREGATELAGLSASLRDAAGSDLARRAAAQFIGKPLTNRETGIKATVSMSTLGKMLSNSAVKNSVSPQAHATAVANLDKLFPLAIRRLTRADNEGDINVGAIHHFDAPMPFGGDVLRVKMLVKELTSREQGARLYTVSAVEIEKPASERGEATPKGDSPAPPAGFDDRFAQMVRAVKGGAVVGQDPVVSGQSRNDEESTATQPPPAADYLNLDDAQFRKAMPPHWDAEQRAAATKTSTYAPTMPLRQRWQQLQQDFGLKATQRIFDQFRSLARLSPEAFMQAHLSKGTDGAIEMVFTEGPPRLHQGAFVVDHGQGGLRGVLSKLNGEHDQFLLWIAGNRAERLAAEGREHLFDSTDIAALKRFNLGTMPDGRSRALAYAQAHAELKKYMKAHLDIAEQAGLLDPASRHLWEHDFYVPFYRVMDEDASVGPGQISGLLRQKAFQKLKGGSEPLGDLLANTLANWSHLLTASMKNLAAQKAIDAAVSMGVAAPAASGQKDTVWIMRNGQQEHYTVDDPLVMESLQAINFTGFRNFVTDAMSAAKRVLTMGVTISPTFRIRNAMRDTISAMATGNVSYNGLRNMVDGWSAMGKSDPTRAAMIAGGGSIRFGSFNDGAQAAYAKRMIAMGIQNNQILNTAERFKNAMRRVFDGWQEVGDRVESINRAVIYQRAIAAGKSHLEASFEARDLMNFTSMGSSTAIRFAAQVMPFFNARLQGLNRLARGAKADPRRFTAVTLGVAMFSALLYLLQRDDEEYQALPDYVRDSHWAIKVGGMWLYLPKPFEVGAMGTVVERATEFAVAGGDYKAKDFASTVASVLVNQLAMNPVPQLFRPVGEAFFNYDMFRDAPIDSPWDKGSDAGKFNERTPAGAIAIGSLLNASPEKVDHVVRGYFGWLGAQALNASDYLLRDAMDLPSNPKQDLTTPGNVFVVGDFLRNTKDVPSKYVTRLYAMQEEIDRIYADARRARDDGDDETVDRLMETPELRMRLRYQRAGNRISRINREIREIGRDPDLSAAEKNRQIRDLNAERNAIARDIDVEARRDE